MATNELRRLYKMNGHEPNAELLRDLEAARTATTCPPEYVERVQKDGVDATVQRLEEHREELRGKVEAARAVRDSLMGEAPARERLITMEDGRQVTIPEFQRIYGLEPDGVLGPETQRAIDDLHYKIDKAAELDRLVSDIHVNAFAKLVQFGASPSVKTPGFAHSSPPPKPDEMRAGDRVVFSHNGRTLSKMFVAEIHKVATNPATGEMFNPSPLHTSPAAFPGRVTHFAITDHRGERRTGWIPLEASQNMQQGDRLTFPAGHLRGNPNKPTRTVTSFAKATKPYTKHRNWARKPVRQMTREEYRQRFSEMRYSVIPGNRVGFLAVVSLARGGEWQYPRPTKKLAHAVGAKRLRRELHRLDRMYLRDNPDAVTARDIGVHFIMSTEELTEELSKAEQKDRLSALEEWDKQFEGEA